MHDISTIVLTFTVIGVVYLIGMDFINSWKHTIERDMIAELYAENELLRKRVLALEEKNRDCQTEEEDRDPEDYQTSEIDLRDSLRNLYKSVT